MRTSGPLEHTSIPTPTGSLTVIADGAVVVAAGFAPLAQLAARLPTDLAARGLRQRHDLGAVTAAVRGYLAGDLSALDAVAVRQGGGEFAQQAWLAMRQIPAGQTLTYTELATQVGRPAASRAAGNACAANLVAPFVPCHRIVPAAGGVGGYAYGAAVKRWLLDHEAQVVPAADRVAG
jgi:methylated-DNA-[protein]-cysteine S-methyltransferase